MKLKEWLNTGNELEDKIFIRAVLTVLFASALFFIFGITVSHDISDILFSSIIMVALPIFTWAYQFKKWVNINTLLFLSMIIIILDAAWFLNKGLAVGLSLDFLALMVLGITMIRKEYLNVFLVIFSINMVSILTVEFISPDFYYISTQTRIQPVLSKTFFIGITYTFTALLVINLKKEYAKTYSLTRRQNALLTIRNNEIERKTKEIENTNANLEQIVNERTDHIKQQREKLLQYAFFNSHKVRAPLSNILGIINLMDQADEYSADEMKQFVHSLKKETLRLDAEIRFVQDIIHETPHDDDYQSMLMNDINTKYEAD